MKKSCTNTSRNLCGSVAKKERLIMTRQTIIEKCKKKATSYNEFLAVQVSLSDLDEVFYVEVKDGVLSVEPYEYIDRQANVIISSEDFAKMLNKKLSAKFALAAGRLVIEGNAAKAAVLAEIFSA